MTPRWRTRADTPLARALGIEAHVATFRHREDPGGVGRVVCIQIPETPAPLISQALRIARAMKARIVVVGDTHEQAEALATRIAMTCTQHQRVPYERASTGAFGPLS